MLFIITTNHKNQGCSFSIRHAVRPYQQKETKCRKFTAKVSINGNYLKKCTSFQTIICRDFKTQFRNVKYKQQIARLNSRLLLFPHSFYYYIPSHVTFTCSKSIIETLEKGVKYVQKSTIIKQLNLLIFKVKIIDVVLGFLLLTLNIFYTFFQCFYC